MSISSLLRHFLRFDSERQDWVTAREKSTSEINFKMKGGLLKLQSKFLSNSYWYDGLRGLKYEDDFRLKLMEISINHQRLHNIGLEMKMLLRCMLEYNELHEYLFTRMNEAAMEADALQRENEKISSLCVRMYKVPKRHLQAMENDHRSKSTSAFKALFKKSSKASRKLERT